MTEDRRSIATSEQLTMEKELSVAVEWWADRLRETAMQDNGDAMTGALMLMMAKNMRPPTDEQIATFKEALTKAMRERLAGPAYGHSIYNDYGVDPALRAAADAAGIEAKCPPFPIKTCLWIKAGRVSVRYGYGAPEKVLWEAS